MDKLNFVAVCLYSWHFTCFCQTAVAPIDFRFFFSILFSNLLYSLHLLGGFLLTFNPNLGLPGGSVVENPPANAEGMGSIPGSSPGDENGNPLHYSLPGKSHGQRSLPGYSPWGCKRVRQDLATEQQQSQFTMYTLVIRFWEDAYRASDTKKIYQ